MATQRQRRKAAVWRLVVNSYPCPECHVPPGRACVTVRNHPKPEPHAARSLEAAKRGWAFADADARCYRCHRPLDRRTAEIPPDPGLCIRCRKQDERARPLHATKDRPGPDGSYDVPLFGEE